MNCPLVVDIGTSSSLAAAWSEGEEKVITNGFGIAVPSVVSFTIEDDVVGKEALHAQDENPHKTVFYSQVLLGDTNLFTQLPSFVSSIPYEVKLEFDGSAAIIASGNREVSPEEVVEELLVHMAALAREQLNQDVTSIYMVVPNSLSLYQRILMKAAVESAGYLCLGFISSCTAAAVDYFLREPLSGVRVSLTKTSVRANLQKKVLVLDVGAGSSNASVFAVHGGIEVLATAGTNSFGGDTIDQKLFSHLADKFRQQHQIDITSCPKAMVSLRQAVKHAKVVLNVIPSTTICLRKLFPGVILQEELTQNALSDFCQETVESELNSLLSEVLRRAKIEAAQIAEVVLVGEATAMKCIREKMERIFKGRRVVFETDRQERMIRGAARIARGRDSGRHEVHELAGVFIGYYIKGGGKKHLITPEARLPAETDCVLKVDSDDVIEIVEVDGSGTREKMLMAITLEDVLGKGTSGELKINVLLDENAGLEAQFTNLETGQVTPFAISEKIKEAALKRLNQENEPDALERMRLGMLCGTASFSKEIQRKAAELKLELALSAEEQEQILNVAEDLDCWIERNQAATFYDIVREKKNLERVLNDIISTRVKRNHKFFL